MKKRLQSFLESIKNKFTENRDFHLLALQYARKHPEGFTLGELCRNSNIPIEQCERMRREFILGGAFEKTGKSREDAQEGTQTVFILSFNGHSRLLAHSMQTQSGILLFLTLVLVFGLMVQIAIAWQQASYTRVQSVPDQINQARARQRAQEFCGRNPEALDSGLFYIESGKPVPCSGVLPEE